MRKDGIVSLTCLAGSLTLALLCGCEPRGVTAAPGASEDHDVMGLGVGHRPPPFAAIDLEGQHHTLEGYAGKVLVLHFWASWCPYCRTQIKELVELHTQWAKRGVRVLSISVDDNLESLQRTVKEHAIPYPVVPDIQSNPSVSEQYGVSGIPVTYVLAPDGRTAFRAAGVADLLPEVKRVVEASPTT